MKINNKKDINKNNTFEINFFFACINFYIFFFCFKNSSIKFNNFFYKHKKKISNSHN